MTGQNKPYEIIRSPGSDGRRDDRRCFSAGV